MRILIVGLLCGLAAMAQNASIGGVVKDATGGVSPTVTITLTSTASGFNAATSTDNDGNFEFPTVRPGAYSIKAEKKGFRTYTQTGIELAVDDRRRIEIQMQLGDTSTVVNVEGSAVAVSTESSSLGSVVETNEIREIPLNGRFF